MLEAIAKCRDRFRWSYGDDVDDGWVGVRRVREAAAQEIGAAHRLEAGGLSVHGEFYRPFRWALGRLQTEGLLQVRVDDRGRPYSIRCLVQQNADKASLTEETGGES